MNLNLNLHKNAAHRFILLGNDSYSSWKLLLPLNPILKETLKNDPISPSSPLESVIFDLAACFNPIFGSFWAF